MIKIRSIHFIDFYYGNAKEYNKIRSTFKVDIVRDLFQISFIYLARQQKFALHNKYKVYVYSLCRSELS